MKPPSKSKVHPIDTLSICVNANFMADMLRELAENKRAMTVDLPALDREANSQRWTGYLLRWAELEDKAGAMIRELVAEIERLRSGGSPT